MQWVYSGFAVAIRVFMQLQWMEEAYRFMIGDTNNIATTACGGGSRRRPIYTN